MYSLLTGATNLSFIFQIHSSLIQVCGKQWCRDCAIVSYAVQLRDLLLIKIVYFSQEFSSVRVGNKVWLWLDQLSINCTSDSRLFSVDAVGVLEEFIEDFGLVSFFSSGHGICFPYCSYSLIGGLGSGFWKQNLFYKEYWFFAAETVRILQAFVISKQRRMPTDEWLNSSFRVCFPLGFPAPLPWSSPNCGREGGGVRIEKWHD